jgi:glycosyltransferase involved in cell wall biosynthesis
MDINVWSGPVGAFDRTVRILGTRGIPAAYGGFETAAENVALFLRDRGWRVVVYCQEQGSGPIREDEWKGIERITIPVRREGWLGTVEFDLASIRHASRHRDVCLTFGYNTAVFNVLQRIKGIPNVINMDGMEWSRSRWGLFRRSIFWANERIACRVGDHLIADHPKIHEYLLSRVRPSMITMIAYGAHAITEASAEPVTDRGLEPGRYFTLICRPIRENSILELVQGFSRSKRGVKLAILGNYNRDDEYHRRVLEAASEEVVFLGALYEQAVVQSLRLHSLGYLHGHTVGGTNPSLVEAMAAGNPIIAHNNQFNRWVAQDGALYFADAAEADARITELIANSALRISLGAASRRRHAEEFTWKHVAGQYEALLLDICSAKSPINGPINPTVTVPGVGTGRQLESVPRLRGVG